MAVTDMLTAEHETVLGKLAELEAAVNGKDRKGVLAILPFFEEDIRLHRRKEEEVLFPAIGRYVGVEGGPIGCMLHEHEEEKGLVAAMRAAAQEPGSDAKLRATALRFVDFLRTHIRKENEILFPMCERMLSPAEKEEVFSGMRAIGACCDVCAHHAGEPKPAAR